VRALMATFKVLPSEEATQAQIAQGVVYILSKGTMTHYAQHPLGCRERRRVAPRHETDAKNESGRTFVQPL
jgi:hypothetical protein